MYNRTRMTIDRRLKAQHPDEPWRWRKEWVEKRATHSHLQDGLVLLGIALVWNALWGGAIWYLFFEAEDPSPIRWVMLPFAAFGPLLLVGAVRGLYNGIRYQRSTLLLDTVPQPAGRRFIARVQMPSLPDGDVWSELLCAMRRTQRSHGETLWKKEQQIPRASIQQTADAWNIPIDFELPADAKETADLGQPGEISWTLTITLGKDRHSPVTQASFPIPVFGGRAEEVDEFEAALAAMPEDVQRRIRDELALKKL